MRRIFTAFVSLAGALIAAASPVMADPPPVSAFFAESPVADIAVSPNGASVAALVRTEGRRGVNVMDTQTLAVTRTISLPENVRPAWVEWANDERLMVAVVVGEWRFTASRIEFPVARVLAMDVTGANAVVLFENQRSMMRQSFNLATVTDLLPDDRDHVLMPGARSGDLDLWKVNVYTGAAQRVATGSAYTVSWRTDAAGNPAYRYDLNSRGTVLRIFAPDAQGAWRRVATVRRDDLPEFDPVAVGPSPNLSYVIARPEGADRAAVYLYDFHANQFSETVASHERVDIGGVFVNPRTSEYLGYYTFDDIYETHFTDAGVQNHVNGLRRFFGDQTSFSIVDMSEDQRIWLVAASDPRDPGALYLYDRPRASIELLTANNPLLRPEMLGETRVVRYRTRDDAEITGYLTLPAGAGAGPHPLVIMPHGGPELRDFLTYDRMTQFLATRGYAVFRPNFRGSSGYGRAFAEAGYGEWGGRMQDDVTDAIPHLIGMGVADAGRVCIVGASYGGYAALAGAAFTPDAYRCAVSIAGVADLVDQARYVIRVGDSDEQAYIRRSIGDPRADRERLLARSPTAHARNIRVPVLLLHGDQDSIVPVEHSRKMNRALREAGGNVRYIELENVGHSAWSKEDETRLLNEVASFLAEHLPAAAPASAPAQEP